MSPSLLTRTIDSGHEAVQRLRDVLWAIIQASAAAGLAWYIAHDLLGHRDPFFAPITAAVCLSASNLFHAQRAVQNISGVALGIVLGAAVQALLGTESIGIAVAVLVTLCIAVLLGRGVIGQGLTFANQAASSAILVMALSNGDHLFQRLQEALIGGGLAVVFSLLLLPANPLTVLRNARIGVLGALRDILAKLRTRPAVAWQSRQAGRTQRSIWCTNGWTNSSKLAPALATWCALRRGGGRHATPSEAGLTGSACGSPRRLSALPRAGRNRQLP